MSELVRSGARPLSEVRAYSIFAELVNRTDGKVFLISLEPLWNPRISRDDPVGGSRTLSSTRCPSPPRWPDRSFVNPPSSAFETSTVLATDSPERSGPRPV